MEKATYIKAIFITIFSFMSSIFGALAIPIILLVLCNIIDYITGLIASPYRKENVNSYKSIRGIFKKVGMWLLIVVGVILDELLKYAASTIGITIPLTFLIACVVAIWLICNEAISILENLKDIGTKIPGFLLPLTKNIKSQVENKMKINNTEGE